MCFHARLKGRDGAVRTGNEGLSAQKSGSGQRAEDELVNVRKSVSVLNNEGETARKRIKKKNWGEKTDHTSSAPQQRKSSLIEKRRNHTELQRMIVAGVNTKTHTRTPASSTTSFTLRESGGVPRLMF